MVYVKISLIVLLITMLIGAQTSIVNSDMGSGMEVLASKHTILYPAEIEFKLQAQANYDIQEIRLIYQIQGTDVTLYGYPRFKRGRKIVASFTVSTNGSSFIPVGVDIQYMYRIVDSDGNIFETDKFEFQYLDPKYRWQQSNTEYITVFSHDLPEAQIEKITQTAIKKIDFIKGSVLGLKTPKSIRAVVVNNRREAQKAFPFPSGAAEKAHAFGGFAFPEYGLFIMQGLNTDTMIHESIHLLISQALMSPGIHIPAWLNEGLAMYFEKNTMSKKRRISNAQKTGSLLNLNSMTAMPGRLEDISLFYAQSWSLVRYIMDEYGHIRMQEFLKDLDSGRNTVDSLKIVYGITPKELENDWRNNFFGEAPAGSRSAEESTNKTILVILIITGILLVTCVLVLSVISIKKRNQIYG